MASVTRGSTTPRDTRCLQRMSEVHDPVLNALIPLATTDDGLAQLLTVRRFAALWPEELTDAHRLAPTPESRTSACALLVDVADQADVLPELMQIACAMAPDDARLARVARLVDRVEEIFNHCPPPLNTQAKDVSS